MKFNLFCLVICLLFINQINALFINKTIYDAFGCPDKILHFSKILTNTTTNWTSSFADKIKNKLSNIFNQKTKTKQKFEIKNQIDNGIIDNGIIDNVIIDNGIIDNGIIDNGIDDKFINNLKMHTIFSTIIDISETKSSNDFDIGLETENFHSVYEVKAIYNDIPRFVKRSLSSTLVI